MKNVKSGVILLGIAAFTLFLAINVVAQEQPPTEKTYHFDGDVSITNNGFSLIPTFSLGDPALITTMSIGGNRFSFDPQFRFDLNGLRPWSFIFIWRYKLIDNEKFELKLGAHLPAIAFRKESYVSNGNTETRLIPSRFITPEVTPTYTISDHVGVGMYYLFGIGLEKENQTKYTHFISARAYVTDIYLGKTLYIDWVPQFYYLTLDGTDGTYFSHTLTLNHDKWPVYISTMMNVELSSEINTKNFDWSINLGYVFNNDFTRKRN